MQLGTIKTLLIVWHSRTGTAEALARAVHDGAMASGEAVDIRLIGAADVLPDMLLTAVSLLVAVVPEGLPAVITATLAHFDLDISRWNQLRWGAGQLKLLVAAKHLK